MGTDVSVAGRSISWDEVDDQVFRLASSQLKSLVEASLDEVEEWRASLFAKELLDPIQRLLASLGHSKDAYLECETKIFHRCIQWAKWWCRWAIKKRDRMAQRAQAIRRNYEDRPAYVIRKFTEEGYKKGLRKIADSKTAAADDRSEKAKELRRAGHQNAEIAEMLNCSVRTVQRYCNGVTDGKESPAASSTKEFIASKQEKKLPCVTSLSKIALAVVSFAQASVDRLAPVGQEMIKVHYRVEPIFGSFGGRINRIAGCGTLGYKSLSGKYSDVTCRSCRKYICGKEDWDHFIGRFYTKEKSNDQPTRRINDPPPQAEAARTLSSGSTGRSSPIHGADMRQPRRAHQDEGGSIELAFCDRGDDHR